MCRACLKSIFFKSLQTIACQMRRIWKLLTPFHVYWSDYDDVHPFAIRICGGKIVFEKNYPRLSINRVGCVARTVVLVYKYIGQIVHVLRITFWYEDRGGVQFCVWMYCGACMIHKFGIKSFVGPRFTADFVSNIYFKIFIFMLMMIIMLCWHRAWRYIVMELLTLFMIENCLHQQRNGSKPSFI